ncbi:MAPEG domain containing protein [Pyrenophora teres f. maculata]|nr:MAPEG domain containing protein [Pyrenophora teres f. maculata]
MADEKEHQVKRVAAGNGITYLTKPDSVMQSLVHAIIKLLPGVDAASITSGRAIPALSAIYLFWTFGASGAISVAGQAMSRREGLDTDHPRKHVHALEGLPLRMRSAHYALLENFPAFALAAALAQVLAPQDAQVVNLLGFHVIAKLMVHYPAYVGNMAVPRSVAHLTATSALINICWILAAGK